MLMLALDTSVVFSSYLHGFAHGQIKPNVMEGVLLAWGGLPSAGEVGQQLHDVLAFNLQHNPLFWRYAPAAERPLSQTLPIFMDAAVHNILQNYI
jgi:hypothetical protein